MAFDASVHAKAVELTKLSVQMTTAAGSGHPTSAASLAHIVTVLMYDHMRYEPANPRHPASDRLVLSEGHAVPIVYAAAADLGMAIQANGQNRPMTRDDAMALRAIDSPIDGHPNPIEGFPFFDAATGSLGQGLSVAAGLGLAARLDGVPKRIFCLIGDGESREGQIWEAIDFIADNQLASVLPIINCNVYAQSDPVSDQQSPAANTRKLEAAGFDVQVIDGHDPSQVRDALQAHGQRADAGPGKPMAIVANCIKGWGAVSMHGHGQHGKPVDETKLEHVLAELDATAAQLSAAWTDGDLNIPPITAPSPEGGSRSAVPAFTDAMERFDKSDILAKGKWATRRAYGIALRALGHADPNVVATDGDVKNSTFAEDFAKDEQLAERYFEARIAEQNMISLAVGLSAGGKIPFASSFGKFLVRAYDQIEMAINSGANVKIVGSHVGVSLAADGPSQMALPDMAFFGAFSRVTLADGRPAMYVLQPADAYAAYALTLAMAEHDGPCYMRTHRPDTPFLYNDSTPFALGGHEVLTEGGDLLMIASGYMVHEARKALPALQAAGIDVTLVDLYSIPFDGDVVLDLAQESNGMVMTLEDNYGGGLGAAIAEQLAEDGGAFTLRQMHARRVPKSGRTPEDVMKYLGLSADDIVAEATQLMEVASS